MYCNFFQFLHAGWIIGARYFRALEDASDHLVEITLEADNTILAAGKFKKRAASGSGAGTWESMYFQKRIPVVTSTRYYVCVSWGTHLEWHTNGALTGADITTGDIFEPRDSSTHWNAQTTASYDWHSIITHVAGVRYALDPIFVRSP